MTMLIRLAIRNLFRRRWRTALTVGGIAVSTALVIWLLSLLLGIYSEMARGTTSVELGQVQIHSAEFVERQSIHHHFTVTPEFIEALAAVEGVGAVAPRIIVSGLVGHEEQSRISRIKGVDPERETQVTILEEALVSGRWLTSEEPQELGPRQVVLGSVMARSLDLEVDDELVVLVQAADGALGNELLQVQGIVETGHLMIDRQTAFMHIEDLRFITALEGEAHEIALTSALDDAPQVAAGIRALLIELGDTQKLVVRPWQEIATQVYLMVELAQQVSWWLLFIIFAIAAMGIFNTLRMSTIERRAEFGVMMGIGLSRSRLFLMIVLEGVLLGAVGAVIGGIVGGVAAYLTGTMGLNLEFFTGAESLTLMGVAFAERIFYEVPPQSVIVPVIGVVVVTALCALWPAVVAIGQKPRDGIAGR